MKKGCYLLLCLCSTAYTLWYMHFGVPYKNSGALSTIGLTHRALFVVWGVLTFVTLSIGIAGAYRRFTHARVYLPLLSVAGAGMALTLLFDFDYNKMPDYYLHCGGSLVFSVTMGIAVFLLFLLQYKRDKLCRIFTFVTAGMMLLDLVLLLIFKENALIETLPVFAAYVMLCTVHMRRETLALTR